MTIKITEGTVRHNDVSYSKGSIIKGLSENDESRLVSMKVAEYFDEGTVINVPENNADNNLHDPTDPPVNSDGQKGKDNIDLSLNPNEYIADGNQSNKAKK